MMAARLDHLKIGANTYQFRPCIQIADIKGAQSICGSQCGGYYGCPTCEIHRMDLSDMIIGLTTKVRSIKTTIIDSSAARAGQRGLPIWLAGLEEGQLDAFLKIFFIGYIVLSDHQSAFEKGIKDRLGKSDPSLKSNMYASDWRALWTMYEHIFVEEFFDEEDYPLVKKVVKTFCLLNHHFYSRFGQRDQKSVLRVYLLIFQHHVNLQKLFPSKDFKIYKSHYHQLVAHLARKYRRYGLFELNSELEEASWKVDRIVETKHSNHKDNQTENIQIRTKL